MIEEVDGHKVIVVVGYARRVNGKLVIVSRDSGIRVALYYYPHEDLNEELKLGARLFAYDPTTHDLYPVWVYRNRRLWLIQVPSKYMPREGERARILIMI